MLDLFQKLHILGYYMTDKIFPVTAPPFGDPWLLIHPQSGGARTIPGCSNRRTVIGLI